MKFFATTGEAEANVRVTQGSLRKRWLHQQSEIVQAIANRYLDN